MVKRCANSVVTVRSSNIRGTGVSKVALLSATTIAASMISNTGDVFKHDVTSCGSVVKWQCWQSSTAHIQSWQPTNRRPPKVSAASERQRFLGVVTSMTLGTSGFIRAQRRPALHAKCLTHTQLNISYFGGGFGSRLLT